MKHLTQLWNQEGIDRRLLHLSCFGNVVSRRVKNNQTSGGVSPLRSAQLLQGTSAQLNQAFDCIIFTMV
ncbi:MAG: hypothetical protein ACUVTH_15350, partial [Thermogutta sp.]